jgi:hypothetical protein
VNYTVKLSACLNWPLMHPAHQEQELMFVLVVGGMHGTRPLTPPSSLLSLDAEITGLRSGRPATAIGSYKGAGGGTAEYRG